MTMISGFPNVANTCYMNSVLTALFTSDHVAKYLDKDGGVDNAKDDNGKAEGLTPILRDMCDLFNRGEKDTRDTCIKFLRMLKTHPKFTLEIGRQNDANEFLLQLLDAILEEHKTNSSSKQAAQQPIVQQRLRLYQKMDKEWQRSVLEPYGALGAMFHGQMVHQMKCGACSALSHTPEVFTVLNLSFPEKQQGKVRVSECIERSFQSEQITDCWRCEKCNAIASTDSPATKSVRLWRLPQVLVIVFKRFSPTGQKASTLIILENEMEEKLIKFICSASPFANESGTRYKFRSSVHHYGSARFGHYSSVCMSGDEVVVVDDDSVSSINDKESSELQRSIYMAVFER